MQPRVQLRRNTVEDRSLFRSNSPLPRYHLTALDIEPLPSRSISCPPSDRSSLSCPREHVFLTSLSFTHSSKSPAREVPREAARPRAIPGPPGVRITVAKKKKKCTCLLTGKYSGSFVVRGCVWLAGKVSTARWKQNGYTVRGSHLFSRASLLLVIVKDDGDVAGGRVLAPDGIPTTDRRAPRCGFSTYGPVKTYTAAEFIFRIGDASTTIVRTLFRCPGELLARTEPSETGKSRCRRQWRVVYDLIFEAIRASVPGCGMFLRSWRTERRDIVDLGGHWVLQTGIK